MTFRAHFPSIMANAPFNPTVLPFHFYIQSFICQRVVYCVIRAESMFADFFRRIMDLLKHIWFKNNSLVDVVKLLRLFPNFVGCACKSREESVVKIPFRRCCLCAAYILPDCSALKVFFAIMLIRPSIIR